MPVMAEYYGQRTEAGVIISEATMVSQEAGGYPRAPGIWTEAQLEGWKPITKAVHDKGGKIIMQLWHLGRVGHSAGSGLQCVAPSPIKLGVHHVHTYKGRIAPETPREMTKDDIQRTVKDYEQAAKNAKAAGFDGVQVHAANGYLLEQFLKTTTNKRTDEYGGSPENNVRILRDILTAVTGVWGADRVSVRLSPNATTYEASYDDASLEPYTRAAAKVLQDFKLSFVELREPGPEGTFTASTQPKQTHVVRDEFKGIIVRNSDIFAEEAESIVANGEGDAVSIGRPFIANPDLVSRFKNRWPLAQSTVADYYIEGTPDHDNDPKEKGYSDWPFYQK